MNFWILAAAFLTGIFASLGLGGGMILILYMTIFAGYTQLDAQGINLIFFMNKISYFSISSLLYNTLL